MAGGEVPGGVPDHDAVTALGELAVEPEKSSGSHKVASHRAAVTPAQRKMTSEERDKTDAVLGFLETYA